MKEETTRTKPFVCLNPDDILKANNKSLTCGLEVELFVIKKDTGKLLKEPEVMEQILKLLPENITKDYYPYQLEIRTPPCRTASEMIKVFLKSLSDAYDVLHSLGYTLCPSSWHHNTNVFNGIHFHVRYKTNNFYNEMINVYPFILAIASHFRSCPEGLNCISRRLKYSPHIGYPEYNPKDFMTFRGDTEEGNASRYKDMVFNGFTDNSRHRNKSVHTLEVRCLDIPLKFNSFKLMIELLFAVFKSLDFAHPVIADMGLRKYKNLSYDTREESFRSRHGKNYFFGMFNEDLIQLLTKKFKLNYVENPFLKNVTSGDNFNPMKYNPINVFKVREPKVIKGIKIEKPKIPKKMFDAMSSATYRNITSPIPEGIGSIEHLEVGDNARLFRCEHCPNLESHMCMPETLGLGMEYEDDEDYDDEEMDEEDDEEMDEEDDEDCDVIPRMRNWASPSITSTGTPFSNTTTTSGSGGGI